MGQVIVAAQDAVAEASDDSVGELAEGFRHQCIRHLSEESPGRRKQLQSFPTASERLVEAFLRCQGVG